MHPGGDDTVKALLNVGIGTMGSFTITLDTGSVGLRFFDPTTDDLSGNGVTCDPTKPTSVTYGNPARVTYTGDTCYAQITMGGVATPVAIPFALLKTMTVCTLSSGCKTPQQNYADGNYGVFGAGIAPGDEIPNPLRTLAGDYGKRFMLRLNADVSVPSYLVLAPAWNFNAAIFPQGEETIGALGIKNYVPGYACVTWLQGMETVCPQVTFDTGNGVPWFHVAIPNLPTVTGGVDGTTVYVAPGVTLTLAPRVGAAAAITLQAGSTFLTEFRYEDQQENLANMAIQAFLGNDVLYDGDQGVITIAPSPIAAANATQ
jgi:hypothetical protein